MNIRRGPCTFGLVVLETWPAPLAELGALGPLALDSELVAFQRASGYLLFFVIFVGRLVLVAVSSIRPCLVILGLAIFFISIFKIMTLVACLFVNWVRGPRLNYVQQLHHVVFPLDGAVADLEVHLCLISDLLVVPGEVDALQRVLATTIAALGAELPVPSVKLKRRGGLDFFQAGTHVPKKNMWTYFCSECRKVYSPLFFLHLLTSMRSAGLTFELILLLILMRIF